MASLVTLIEAKAHLRVLASDQDTDITAKALAASDIVIDYIKRPDHEWTDADAPPLIKAAILLVLGNLFFEREGAMITDGVKSILHRYRDPALA
jgi:hypothetical protein